MLQLKQALTGTYEYMFHEDAAIDREHPDFDPKAYEEDWDPKHLPVKSGEKPTRFICRPLSREAVTKVVGLTGPAGMDNQTEAAQLTVAYGLRSIANGPDVPWKVGNGDRLDSKTMDALFQVYGLAFFGRLAQVIFARSALSPF